MKKDRKWWGTSELAADQILHWEIGPFRLWLQRLETEYRLAHTIDDDLASNQVTCCQTVEDLDLLTMDNSVRFALAKTVERVELTPALADRPVVARPEKPLIIPPGESLHLFVHSPLWLKLTAGKKQIPLVAMPLLRPSDTWFGPSTREGELCYASRSFFQLRLDELPYHPHRASTSVHLHNRTSSALALERVQLPVKHLGLFSDPEGRLWTEEVTLVRDKATDFASVTFKESSPIKNSKLQRVSAARETTGGNIVLRAFSSLFA